MSDSLTMIGFNVLHTFEEVTCDVASWTMMPSS